MKLVKIAAEPELFPNGYNSVPFERMNQTIKGCSLDELFELLRSKLKELEATTDQTTTFKQRAQIVNELEIIEKAIDEKRLEPEKN